MDETETNSMRIEAYHTATRLHTVDIQLDANRAAFVTAQKMRNQPKMQALKAKRAEITEEIFLS